jgi:hypothetical protein
MFILTIFCFALNTNAQIKVKTNGRTFVGDPTTDWGAELNVKAQNYPTFYTESYYTTDNWWHNTGTNVNKSHTVSWVVRLNGDVKFYVEGNGQAVATNFYESSDSTYKENIHQINDALDKVKALRGVNYNWKEEFFPRSDSSDSISSDFSKKEFGLIAQEVETVLPEVVAKNCDGKKVIAYTDIIPIIIEAMKEQQLQIETLQTIVYSQENELVELKKALSDSSSIKSNGSGFKSTSLSEETTVSGESESEKAILYGNQPNPFFSDTEIKYVIPENSSSAKLIIHDMQGIELKSFTISQKGLGSIVINGSELRAGMYLYTLIVDNKNIDSKRMILTKE